MTTPRPGSRAEQRRRTEARILAAATQVFFGAGYDRATIRAVASAAGVDAGLVMHYYGSKQELYRRVIDAAPVPEVSGTPAEAAEQILAGLASRLASEPAASLALLRSMLTNPEAADYPRHHGLPAPHQGRRTRHRRPGAGHQAAASLRAFTGSPPRPQRAALGKIRWSGSRRGDADEDHGYVVFESLGE
jgi:AcrR family transcriptional regulator